MRQIILIFLVFIFFIENFSPLYSADLFPPWLGEVMKVNEKRQKLLLRKSGKILPLPGPIEVILSFHTLKKSKAITITRYDYIELWVQEIDLTKWGYIKSILTLGWYDELNGEPLFQRKKFSEVKSWLDDNPVSIINGQFFDPKRSITPLSFGVKVDWVVRTAGADNRNESKNLLILEKNIAKIVPYSWENLRDAPWYFALVNLTLEKSHYPNEMIGRTYICLKNPDINNQSSQLLIFTATAITESLIESEMIRWGCTKPTSAKLDSSWSTRLWIGEDFIFWKSHKGYPDYRSIPHSIAIYDGQI